MITTGRIVICDRCGKAILLARLEDETVFLDNKPCSFPVYEDLPEGWADQWGNHFCPECSSVLEKVMKEFYQGGSDVRKDK